MPGPGHSSRQLRSRSSQGCLRVEPVGAARLRGKPRPRLRAQATATPRHWRRPSLRPRPRTRPACCLRRRRLPTARNVGGAAVRRGGPARHGSAWWRPDLQIRDRPPRFAARTEECPHAESSPRNGSNPAEGDRRPRLRAARLTTGSGFSPLAFPTTAQPPPPSFPPRHEHPAFPSRPALPRPLRRRHRRGFRARHIQPLPCRPAPPGRTAPLRARAVRGTHRPCQPGRSPSSGANGTRPTSSPPTSASPEGAPAAAVRHAAACRRRGRDLRCAFPAGSTTSVAGRLLPDRRSRLSMMRHASAMVVAFGDRPSSASTSSRAGEARRDARRGSSP